MCTVWPARDEKAYSVLVHPFLPHPADVQLIVLDGAPLALKSLRLLPIAVHHDVHWDGFLPTQLEDCSHIISGMG